MRRRQLLGSALALLALPRVVRAQEPAVPEHNSASLTAPPPRPPLGAAGEERARRLFDAIVHDDPASADDFFLSREAFRLVKRVPSPDPLWERLHAAYARDVHALHAATRDLERATFARLRFTGRRGWVGVGEEANRLPYWAQRHSLLEYTVGGETRSIEVRTMITWDDQWYVTHLSEFHH